MNGAPLEGAVANTYPGLDGELAGRRSLQVVCVEDSLDLQANDSRRLSRYIGKDGGGGVSCEGGDEAPRPFDLFDNRLEEAVYYPRECFRPFIAAVHQGRCQLGESGHVDIEDRSGQRAVMFSSGVLG